MNDLSSLSISDLAAHIHGIAKNERVSLADFVLTLAEMHRRGAHLELGHPSLFAFCTDALHLPRASAYRRTAAARLVQRFPAAIDFLRDGRLNTTTLLALEDVLTDDNHLDLLRRASHLNEAAVERLVVTIAPREEKPDSIRKCPTRSPAAVASAFAEQTAVTRAPSVTRAVDASTVVDAGPDADSSSRCEVATPTITHAPRPTRPVFEPVSESRTRIAFNVGAEFMQLLEDVKSALSHKLGENQQLETVFTECLRVTLETLTKKRLGSPRPASRSHTSTVLAADTVAPVTAEAVTSTPLCAEARSVDRGDAASTTDPAGSILELDSSAAEWTPPKTASRYIAVEVCRAVWKRDEGRCAFVGVSGRRCDSRHQLEFDHVEPHALGGPSTVENIRLLCRAHNQHRQRQFFGDLFADTFAPHGCVPSSGVRATASSR